MSITPFKDREALRELGERLRRERLQRNQTQAQVAELAGVTRSTYAKLEAGDGTVQLSVLARVMGQMGHAERLPELMPELPVPVDFDELARREARQRARPRVARKPAP